MSPAAFLVAAVIVLVAGVSFDVEREACVVAIVAAGIAPTFTIGASP